MAQRGKLYSRLRDLCYIVRRKLLIDFCACKKYKQRKNLYGCKKCAKGILVMREGANPSAPFCCGKTMSEIKARL